MIWPLDMTLFLDSTVTTGRSINLIGKWRSKQWCLRFLLTIKGYTIFLLCCFFVNSESSYNSLIYSLACKWSRSDLSRLFSQLQWQEQLQIKHKRGKCLVEKSRKTQFYLWRRFDVSNWLHYHKDGRGYGSHFVTCAFPSSVWIKH